MTCGTCPQVCTRVAKTSETFYAAQLYSILPQVLCFPPRRSRIPSIPRLRSSFRSTVLSNTMRVFCCVCGVCGCILRPEYRDQRYTPKGVRAVRGVRLGSIKTACLLAVLPSSSRISSDAMLGCRAVWPFRLALSQPSTVRPSNLGAWARRLIGDQYRQRLHPAANLPIVQHSESLARNLMASQAKLQKKETEP